MISYLLYAFRTLAWGLSRLLSGRAKAPDYVVFSLDGALPFLPAPSRWSFGRTGPSLKRLTESCRRVQADPRITGVVFHLRTHLSPAGGDLLRGLMADLRAAGKRVVVFAPDLNGESYRIACAADQIILQEGGWIGQLGMARSFLFLKDGLDRLGIRAEVIPSGPYKTPGTLDRMSLSEPVRENMNQLLDGELEALIDAITQGRGVSRETAVEWIDKGPVIDLDAVDLGMVDRVMAEEDLPAFLAVSGRPARLVRWSKARRAIPQQRPTRPGRYVALIRIQGAIVPGHSRFPPTLPPVGVPMLFSPRAGDVSVVQAARRIQADKRAAACVVWIDSPGGSATASESMYQALKALDAKKPVVAVMGSVAASGGYYVAAAARHVVAQPGTLTGSIGALWMKLTLGDFFTRLSLKQEILKRGRHAAMDNPATPYSRSQRELVEHCVERIYDVFRNRVATGRGLTPDEVDTVGHGRVFWGDRAHRHQLVDSLGGLEQALQTAKKMANLPDNAALVEIIPGKRPGLAPAAGEASLMLYGAETVSLLGREGVSTLCPILWDGLGRDRPG